MKRAALLLAVFASALPADAKPSVPAFNRDDAGIMGCQAQAAPRGGKAWGSRVDAIWPLGQATVVMADGEALRSYADERRDAGGRTSMWWEIGRFRAIAWS